MILQVDSLDKDLIPQKMDFETEDSGGFYEETSKELVKKRKEAVDGRANTGIEKQWEDDEEAYAGVDAVSKNERLESTKADYAGYSGAKDSFDGVRSTAVLNITRLYVDSAAARCADMLLPTDDHPFGVKPTPKRDVRLFGNQISDEDNLLRVQNADTCIKDWLTEGKWSNHARKVIESAARLGTGVIKGPFPVERKFAKAKLEVLRNTLSEEQKLEVLYRPASEFIPVVNLYPDPNCGNNIQNGEFLFEKREMSVRKFRDLKNDPSYISEQVCRCLEEGPSSSKEIKEKKEKKNTFELWLYWGPLPKRLFVQDIVSDLLSEILAVGSVDGMENGEPGEEEMDEDDGEAEDTSEDEAKECHDIFGHAVLCNDRIIKVAKPVLDNEEFPFDVLCWQEQDDFWAGRGVAYHARTPQRGLTAALRNLLDNAALTSGPQIVTWKGVLEPKDGRWGIYPRKHWVANVDNSLEGLKQVQNAIMTIDIPGHINELMSVIKFFLEMAEQSTGISMVFQGMGQSAKEQTLGGIQMQTNMASSVLRRVARNFDDFIVENQIDRYYDWIKMYGPEEAQGELQVEARGSSTLIERDLQVQALTNLLPLSLNPAYGVSPEKMMEMFVRAQRFEYSRVKTTDEEKQAVTEGTPIQVEVAKIKAESAKQIAQLQEEMEKYKVDVKAAIEQIRVGAKGQITGAQIAAKKEEGAVSQENKEPSVKSTLSSGVADEEKRAVLSQLGLG